MGGGAGNETMWGRGSSAALSRVIGFLLLVLSLGLTGGGLGFLPSRGVAVAAGFADGEAFQARAIVPSVHAPARPRVQNKGAGGSDAPGAFDAPSSVRSFPPPPRDDGVFASSFGGESVPAASGLLSTRMTMGPPVRSRSENLHIP